MEENGCESDKNDGSVVALKKTTKLGAGVKIRRWGEEEVIEKKREEEMT